MRDGSDDIAAAAEALAARLPAAIRPLAAIAMNYWWSWAPDGAEVFSEIDVDRWLRGGRNPVRLLQEVTTARLAALAGDQSFVERVRRLDEGLQREREAPPRAGLLPGSPTAFFCAEFGIHGSLPFYAGGLGVLAGDLLKQASDCRVPMVGVGLFYRQGSFHQRLDASGWQHEYWLDTDSERLPAAVVTDPAGSPLLVEVPLAGRTVRCQVWRVDAGRVPLYLLDSDVPENSRADRWITARLYVSDREMRLAQYVLLGIGGMRALRALGIDPGRLHLNEGHAVLAALELLRERVAAGEPFEDARVAVRRCVMFTTHTPVAAGNESFSLDQVRAALPGLPGSLALSWDELASLARVHPDDAGEGFGLTPLALRLSGAANGVSKLHGQVSRAMWRDIWPGRPVESVPIAAVPNGIHLPTWIAPEMRALLDRYVPGWTEACGDDTWAAVEEIPDEELWAVRRQLRARLAEKVRRRSLVERLGRGEPVAFAEAPGLLWDDNVLTIGFARRIATYKRLYLLTSNPARARKLLEGPPPLQIAIAGRAHPQDDAAKHTVQQIFALNDIPGIGGHGVFLEEHDMTLAAGLVQGCDLWINLPRPGQEASGTSGMKSAVNGGLHLSVLDGWWAEAFDGQNGWGVASDPNLPADEQDRVDAERVFDILEYEVIPLFYDRDEQGIPRAWLRRVKSSMRSIGPHFSACRMLEDYLRLSAALGR